jgi:hypothetical protein
MKSNIEEYTVTLLKNTCKIRVAYKDKEWEYSTKVFDQKGYSIFPKRLYRLISDDIKYANIYDKFMDRYFEWEESE